MLFNTAQFFAFFAVVLVLFYASPRPARKYLLLVASYVFYASWNIVFLPLLAIITLVDYGCALWMERFTTPSRRKVFLILSIAVNLGFLGFFKYFNFVAGMIDKSYMMAIILPIGISFHTFQSISYIVDVYRGEQKAIRNLADYALFIAFFPQLVAGPIVRAGEFFADFYTWRKPDSEEVLRGALWMLIGLCKKMVFADQFAQIADTYFGGLATHPGATAAWSGVFSFAMQIFFDFSGYTDMAIGMALLLGFHFPVNFMRPYLAFSITDFWHRWHVSLSRWLRDYLYIPLGGNRGGAVRTYRNLMLTMLLGGLWHGASFNFIIWGGYHGALLGIERIAGRKKFLATPGPLVYPLRALFTFVLVCIGWVFFRAVTLQDSLYVIEQMFTGEWTAAGALVPVWLFCFIGIALLIAIAEERWEWMERLPQGSALAYVALVVVLLVSVELIGVTDKAVPFIYFQF
ncbi:MAG: MBOAT family protein [Bryobacteraceae bacterium]